jgi:hypothetical protein
VKHEAHSLLDLVLEISGQTPVSKPQLSAYPVKLGVQIQHTVIGLIPEKTNPGHYAVDTIKHVTMHH